MDATIKTPLLVDGHITTLSEFLYTNTKDPDVDHIASDDAEKVRSLQPGQRVFIGGGASGRTEIVCPVFYRGYIIEHTQSYCPYGGYDFYLASEGRNDDADFDGESYHYCGNVGFASSIDDAKDEIFEKLMCAQPQHKVVMNRRDYYFDWIEDAIKFAVKWNAEEFIPAISL